MPIVLLIRPESYVRAQLCNLCGFSWARQMHILKLPGQFVSFNRTWAFEQRPGVPLVANVRGMQEARGGRLAVRGPALRGAGSCAR
jgi:hypothetical protein